MKGHLIRASLLFWAVVAIVVAVEAGTCDPDANPLLPLFQTPTAQFSYQGASILVQPWRKYGVPDPEISMKLDMRRVAEVSRSSTSCPAPGIVSFITDPDTPVTREVLIAACDCTYTRRNVTVQGSSMEEQVKLDVDCSNQNATLYQDFAMQIYFKRPQANYTYHYEPRISSQNKTIDLGYQAGEVSFAMDMQNWPWDPNNTKSYVLVDFRAWPTVGTSVNLTSGSDGATGHVTLESKYSKMTLNAAHSYILDGEPYLPSLSAISESLPLIGGIQNIFFDIRQQLCTEVLVRRASPADIYTTNFRWTNSSYDPTFVTLFSEFDSNPTQNPTVNTVRIAVGVSLGVVAAIIIILVITVPVVKYVIRPYARRADEKGKGADMLEPSKPGWNAATKPKEI